MRLTQEQYDKAKPMHANQEMVRAFLDGIKTQTRRPIPEKVMADMRIAQQIGEVSDFYDSGYLQKGDESYIIDFAPYQPGSIIYIRERARLVAFGQGRCVFRYDADNKLSDWGNFPSRIKSITLGHCVPNGCFKELARLFYEVKGVRVEWIQDISDEDAIAEGVSCVKKPGEADTFIGQFFRIWSDCYPGSWDRNDFVWVYDLERILK